jgi:pimeloyl-ACP methyl ester carboxylesterase
MNGSAAEPPPRYVSSRDGTPIACWSAGSGPPLLLVHGAMSDHSRWRIRSRLEPYRTVHVMDRRGRGLSGDGAEWSVDLEVDDVVAVIEALSEDAAAPVDVLGHSFGGALCLRAAARSRSIGRLVLYEPALNEPPVPAPVLQRMDALLAEGRLEETVQLMMREIVLIPESEIAVLMAQPTWPARVATATTLPREVANLITWRPEEGAVVLVPTLLIQGADSPSFVQEATKMIASSLPDARVVVLEGQQHVADQIVPGVFAGVVLDFLLGRS